MPYFAFRQKASPKTPVTSDDKLQRLLNSALAADALASHGFRRVPRSAIFISTSNKTVDQVVTDAARELRRAGLLKE